MRRAVFTLVTGTLVLCLCGKPNAQLEPLKPYSYKPPTDVYGNSDYVVSPGGKNLGKLKSNAYDANSISNPYGRYRLPYSSESVNNPYGRYGSPYSTESVTNPYTTRAPRIYDSRTGRYKGKLSANKYDPKSISNPDFIYTSQSGFAVKRNAQKKWDSEIRSRRLTYLNPGQTMARIYSGYISASAGKALGVGTKYSNE